MKNVQKTDSFLFVRGTQRTISYLNLEYEVETP
jgi:hypothetical protein